MNVGVFRLQSFTARETPEAVSPQHLTTGHLPRTDVEFSCGLDLGAHVQRAMGILAPRDENTTLLGVEQRTGRIYGGEVHLLIGRHGRHRHLSHRANNRSKTRVDSLRGDSSQS